MTIPGKVRIQDGAGNDRITVDASSNVILNGSTINSIQGDTVIGAAAMTGTEIFRVTGGSVLFDGVTGAVPASGAGTRLMWCPAKRAFRAGEVTGTQWDDANVGSYTTAFGYNTTASGTYSFAVGYGTTASGANSAAFGLYANASLYSQQAFGQGVFSDNSGVVQTTFIRAFRIATDNSPTELSLTGDAPGAGTRLTIPSGKSVACIISGIARCISGADAGLSASWFMTGAVENSGGTTRLVGSPWNLLDTGLLSNSIWTPQGATLNDAGFLTMTLVPGVDNGNSAFTFTFTGHAGAGVNTFHVVVSLTLCEVM